MASAALAVGLGVSMLVVTTPKVAAAAGDWTVVSSPDTSSSDNNTLTASACASADDCWSVGFDSFFDTTLGETVEQTLIEHFDGTSWSIVASPNVDGTNLDVLDAVTCVSDTDCWAVGNTGAATLVEQYDGSSWNVVSSPNMFDPVNPAYNYLNGVACTADGDCWAAGYANNGTSFPETLIEEYDGTGWSIMSTPSPGDTGGYGTVLWGIACPVSGGCFASGYFRDAFGNGNTLVEQDTSAGWVVDPTPNVAPSISTQGSGSDLFGIACVDSSDCWSVGYSYDDHSVEQTLTEHYDGTSWSIVGSPNPQPADQSSHFWDVTCNDASDCTAVGYYVDDIVSATNTLIEQWDGTSWTIVSSPNAGTTSSSANARPGTTASASTAGDQLSDVTCAAVVGCWAVGYYYDSAGFPQTLVEQSTTSQTTTFDDSNASVAFDTWTSVTDPTASGGTYRATATKSATATFKFTGATLTWITHRGPNQGIASVTIDGKKKANVDLYASNPLRYSQKYTGLGSKSHTMVITITGTKNKKSTRATVALDAFVVGTTTTQETSSTIQYDSWAGAASTSASGGSYRTDGKAKATASITFAGTGVTWVTATGPADGKARVTIDGVNKGTVDLYSSAANWQVMKVYTGLSTGTHTIVITVLGTKDTASAGTQVIVDAFAVSG